MSERLEALLTLAATAVAIAFLASDETELIATAASITTLRLCAGGDLVSVAAPRGIDAVRPDRGDPDPACRVHGFYTVVSNVRGSMLVRWTENGVTYEASSRSLDAARAWTSRASCVNAPFATVRAAGPE